MSGTEGFEELDLGRRSRATPPSGRPGPPLPPLSLDASANESSGPAADQPPGGPVAAPPSEPSEPSEPSGPWVAPSSPWQRWVGFGAALAVGATVGIVGANARNDAAAGTVIELVAGTLTAQSPLGFRDFQLQRLTLPLHNAGPRTVVVESIQLTGWYREDGAEELDPIRIEPDAWETITIVLLPDCETRPRAMVTVTARSESERETVELPFPTGDQSRVVAWESACSPQAPYGELQGTFQQVVERDATRLVATVTVQHFGDRQLQVLDLWSSTAGFAITTPILPFVLEPDTPTPIRLELRVNDCAAAAALTELEMYADVEATDGSLVQTQVPVFVADNRLLIEAARFSATACET